MVLGFEWLIVRIADSSRCEQRPVRRESRGGILVEHLGEHEVAPGIKIMTGRHTEAEPVDAAGLEPSDL